ncbi:non-lysosomal glucosylceramidase [Cephus cinctus]|uniref:Non-lysosomal glucosylceramidase n=1 Tax=Cephus cinctus TaxID=211228 RepID=A0AAJ7C9F4_CEPCN|nr:non-lysosomal glucosylceramidase [Cephus cinctus]
MELPTNNELSVDNDIAKYGFKVRLDHEFPEKWLPIKRPRLRQLPHLLPLGLRYWSYYNKIVKDGRIPLMDYMKMPIGLQMYGAPIGGIGGGTIGRGFRGEFCRYALRPGQYQYHTIIPNQFIVTIRDVEGNTIYHQVLSTHKKPKILKSWKWHFDGTKARYTSLYPRSWTEYDLDEVSVKLICRQVSPVIPHNYKDSSLPCAVFIWDVINNSGKDLNIAITFTFQSGTGDNTDNEVNKWTEYFETDNVSGVMIHQKIHEMNCTYAISSRAKNGIENSRVLSFDPMSNGESLWRELEDNGKFEEKTLRASPKTGHPIAAAVSARTLVKDGSTSVLEFSLVWDMPKIHFHYKMREYLKYYTKFFYEPEGSAAPLISQYALSNYRQWEREICNWQRNVLEDQQLPDWYKSALFNELYYVADGGTIWLRSDETDNFPATDPRSEYGRFAYLEGQEYRMYNTYDVHFYAAFALVQLWPHLQNCIQYELRDNVHMEIETRWTTLYEGVIQARKLKGTVPHDMGDPGEEPFKLINSYPIHDVSEWRDLNPKFILSCYRDYVITGNLQLLQDLWPTMIQILERCLTWDEDGDGLIENGGFPDQTYDTWVMKGPSAYCGGLFLAALHCSIEMAKLLGHDADAKKYEEILKRGKVAYQEKLWNGQYYNFDSSDSGHSKSIMSDQLCGHWFLRASGFNYEIFPEDRVKSALKVIFENNVKKYKNGEQGAVNGFLPTGSIDRKTLQSEEMWTGITYGLAALMIHEGMIEEGFKTAEGVYRTVYEKIGMGFETPEALFENKFYRAIGYMRPLSIWAMHLAWESRKLKTMK